MRLLIGRIALLILTLASHGATDPTWPSEVDELEEIMYQLFSFRARKFADLISPCDSSGSGNGRLTAAQWLRSGFHDMGTANVVTGTGGLDGSLQYELDNGENEGPGFANTLTFLAPYITRKSSVADLIALAVYASVRSCGGPAIPFRAGRVDAPGPGPGGLPRPQNSPGTFVLQFERVGFSSSEMVQAVACGHTLGGVHAAEFPQLVPPGTAPNDQATFDATAAQFDNNIVIGYLSGNTSNPLVVGPSVARRWNSDTKVFSVDGNMTVTALTDPQVYQETCRSILQKMIEIVPSGVTLTDPILPYEVKPVDIQLSLTSGGRLLRFTGYVRLRTTGVPTSEIMSAEIRYRNRDGGDNCGSQTCSFSVGPRGATTGFDDTFLWFPIDHEIPASVGISSFTIAIHYANSSARQFDNNGEGYPLQDGIVLQRPQSCLLQTSGKFSITAAVRNDRKEMPASVVITYKVPQSGSPVPALHSETVPLTRGECIGSYTVFRGSYEIPGGLSPEAFVDVMSGWDNDTMSDEFRGVRDIGGTCLPFENHETCSEVTAPSITTITATNTPSTSSSVATPNESSSIPSPTPNREPTVLDYTFVSCWSEGTQRRALRGASYYNSNMTLEMCHGLCSGYTYWGTEYGTECYCGHSLDLTSHPAPLQECSMPCAGNPHQFCGASNRLELYTLSNSSAPTEIPGPTPTRNPEHIPSVSNCIYLGCWTEGEGIRALSDKVLVDENMDLEICSAFCANFLYFGTEYGTECYCGNTLAQSSIQVPAPECSMLCSGNPLQFCGAGNRLEVYGCELSLGP